MKIETFLSELKRLNVYKAAVAYAVVAWLLGFEKNLALIQTMFRENSRAISTLTRLLQPHTLAGFPAPTPVTPALLRLDPLWDPLRADPAFQKLCEEKQP